MDLQALVRYIFEETTSVAISPFRMAAKGFIGRVAATDQSEQCKTAILNRVVLKLAFTIGGVDDLRFLVEQCGASLNCCRWSACEYPTRLAAERRHPEMLRWLVKYGAGLRDADDEPIIFGILKKVHEDHENTIHFIDEYIELGGRLDAVDGSGDSLLVKVINRQWWTVASWIISHGGKAVLQDILKQDHLTWEQLAKQVLPILVRDDRSWSPNFQIEALELGASHAWKYRPNPTLCNGHEIDLWISANTATKCWLDAIHLRGELELPHAWHTQNEPYSRIDLVTTVGEFESCLRDHIQGGTDLIIQCLLHQENIFGTVDATVAEECLQYGWRSNKQYIDLLIYLSHFEVNLTRALGLPRRSRCDIKLSHVCDLISHVIARGIESWERAAAEFVLEVFDHSEYTECRLEREARELDLEQRGALQTLVSRQSWMRDIDDQLIEYLLPSSGN